MLEKIETIDSNIQVAKELRADTVFLIEDTDSKEVLLHIEVQTTDDKNMPKRMHDYRYLLRENYPGKDILQVVLYLGDEKPNMGNVYEKKKTGYIPLFNIKFKSSTRTEFGIIDIGTETVQKILRSRSKLLLNFLCLTERKKRKKNPNGFIEECINKGKEFFKLPEEQEILRNIYQGIIIHAPLIGANKSFVKELLKKEGVEKMIDLKELPLYEEAYEQGKKEGRLEGRTEEKQETVKRLYKLGLDIEVIAAGTELAKEEVKKIIQGMALDEQLRKTKDKNFKSKL